MSQTDIQQEQQQGQQKIQPRSNNKKIIVPPMRYDLIKLTQFETLNNISYFTKGFVDLPIELTNWIHWDVQSRQYTSFGYIPAPPNAEMVKKIIGIDGYYLKLTTQNHGVDFIWHNRVNNEFQFWGEYQRCIRAMNEIRYRICKIVDNFKEAQENDKAATEKKIQASAGDYVFDNDINPRPSVCYEGFIKLNINDDVIESAGKFYPQVELSDN